MPRKAFVADLQDAVATFHKPDVSNLKAGEEDGLIDFDYSSPNGQPTIKVTVLVPGMYRQRTYFPAG